MIFAQKLTLGPIITLLPIVIRPEHPTYEYAPIFELSPTNKPSPASSKKNICWSYGNKSSNCTFSTKIYSIF